MDKSYKSIRSILLEWAVTEIILILIIFPLTMHASDFRHLIVHFFQIFIMVTILNSVGTITGNLTAYFMRKRSVRTIISVLFFVNLCTVIAGNTVCYYVFRCILNSDFYKSETDHLIEVLGVFLPLFILSFFFSSLIMRKNMFESYFRHMQDKIRRDAANTSISIKLNEGHCIVDFESLIYISSHGKRATFHTIKKDYIANYLLKEIEKNLPDDKFVRIHRQYVINLKYLREIKYYEGGRYMVYLNDEDESVLPVGRYITPRLKEKLRI